MTTIPEGWKLVPVEPTPEMEEAGGAATAWDSSMYGGEIDKAVIDIYRAMLAAAPAAPEGATPVDILQEGGLHTATACLVWNFALALANKLHEAEKKYGYSDGWRAHDWMDECRAKLREHVEKGDPRDVAAYCAFLWHHGASTAAPPAQTPAPPQKDLLGSSPREVWARNGEDFSYDELYTEAEDTMSDLLRRYEELCEAEGEQLVDINVDIPKRTYVRMVHQLARALKDVRSQGQDTELRPDGQRRERGETKSDGGAPQTPAAGALTREQAQEAIDHFNDLESCPGLPPYAAYKFLEAIARGAPPQPTAQEPPVLSLNEAYQRICDLFAYEENEKRLNDGLLHILRMATTPQRDSGLDALLREAREALSLDHRRGGRKHIAECSGCRALAKLDAAMQTRGQTDFVQRSSSDCTTVPGLSGDSSVAEHNSNGEKK